MALSSTRTVDATHCKIVVYAEYPVSDTNLGAEQLREDESDDSRTDFSECSRIDRKSRLRSYAVDDSVQ
jgi:hypothetical protein